MPLAKTRKEISIVYRTPAVVKPLIAALLALVVYFIFPLGHPKDFSRIMLGWDVFSFCLLSLYWFVFYVTPAGHIRKIAPEEDAGRIAIFIIIIICTTASMLAVILLLTAKHDTAELKVLHLSLAITGMTFSWSLLHTIFAVRYAHIYYANHKTRPDTHAGGLEFPDEEKPDFVDFAYFSFVLGMTFQVSDISIVSKKIRRMVLWHSLISFGYNAVIIALTINVVAGLGE